MATGVESSPSSSSPPSEKAMVSGIVLDFPLSDAPLSSSPPRIPRRLRKRMLETKASPVSSVEEIEAKLRDADLRRQQFYEMLSTKARPKPRSPSRSSSQDEDLGQRLEAKLVAAEQKRLSILTNARMRLAKLDELRQAAKSGVERRSERERQRLGTKVESRVQQAETNRMLLLKAYKQRHASLKERTSQSLMRRVARESKYKERVNAAINQKRAAAERKRLGLLEAEKKKACDRILQVQQVAKSVSYNREIERRRMRDQLEDRLQRAKRQRAEYLRQRCRQRGSVQVNLRRMEKEAEILSRKLARCWRKFISSRRTTLELVKDYDSLKINENSMKTMPFEQVASLIESPATLRKVKALLDRLESRYKVCRAVDAASYSSTLDNIDHLLKRVASPKRRPTPRTTVRNRDAKTSSTMREVTRSPAKSSRYSVRVVLCAYMILGHPDAVFSGQGEREAALAESAKDFIHEFELLVRIILEGPVQSSDDESDSVLSKRCTFRPQLAVFDKAWCTYLSCFVAWKVKDARSLEEDLVRAACQLELSMIQKLKLSPEGKNDVLTHDMKAIQKQVSEDQKLLREKVQHLGGDAGIVRMQSALDEMRSRYFEAKGNGSAVDSPIMNVTSPVMPSFVGSAGHSTSSSVVRDETPSRVVRSLFKDHDTGPSKQACSSAAGPPKPASSAVTSTSRSADQLSGSAKTAITENEVVLNELLHEKKRGLVGRSNAAEKDEQSLKAKVRETMEKAFWDSIMDSVKQKGPDYDRVINLVKEVRDEISEMAPESWRQTITEAIDLDVLVQVLKSGSLDIEYLGKILEFSLSTLQKLCSPVHEDEMKAKYQNLLGELAETCQIRDNSNSSQAVAMVKGLRFVLEQIQSLKSEISKARIKLMEPLLKGPAGLDYLRKAFTSRYGSHMDACSSLPLTKQWLSSVRSCKDQEIEEHNNSVSTLINHDNPSQVFLPSTALRTGGSFQVKGSTAANAGAGNEQSVVPECPCETVDQLVRLGLLKLVSEISGITPETLPETFALNLSRLRSVQVEIQKLIVIATRQVFYLQILMLSVRLCVLLCVLVCRQTLMMERAVSSNAEMENIVSKCSQEVLQLLDGGDDIGIDEIVNVISRFPNYSSSEESGDSQKVKSRKEVMGRMLGRSLQAGDPVFGKVSRAVYLGARGVVLGGSGTKGRKLAEAALRQVGAVGLTDKVVGVAEVLVVVADVSVGVHGEWYSTLLDSM
ncbi:T-complex protein 11-like protein 1 [Linum grandiflorum]